MRSILVLAAALTFPVLGQWTTVAGNSQHTALSGVAGQALSLIKWQTTVDAAPPPPPPQSANAHYGAPIITAGNSVYVPVHAANSTYEIEVHDGSTGNVRTILNSGWTPPAADWTPSFGPGLSARNVFYFPDANGTVGYVTAPDAGTPSVAGHYAFYGAAMGDFSGVKISTPIVSDRLGNIFFGFIVTGTPPLDVHMIPLASGIARIGLTGAGSWVSAAAIAGGFDNTVTHVPVNAAPVLSNDSQTLYFAVSNDSQNGHLVAVNSSVLTTLVGHQHLIDPNTGSPAFLPDVSTAVPMIGPDGDVYYGVLESDFCCSHHDRGWLLHFDQHLTTSKLPGSFGWDSTPSIVPSNLVPQYHTTSTYLLFSKYNDYTEAGGTGINKIAVLDPTVSQNDPIIPAVQVMNEVITIAGQTPDPEFPAVREWCINSGAIDKLNKSAIVNSEDGNLYRWDFPSNTFTQIKNLTNGVGEAYTPTVIGPDGTVYAINNKVLFAIRAQ